MKGFVIAATLLAGVLPAASADMPEKAKQYNPPQVPACTHCGFYAGGHVLYGWGSMSPEIDITPFSDPAPKGWGGGGHVGYLWQFGHVAGGLEVDYSVADINQDQSVAVGGGSIGLTTKFSALGSARGRGGFILGDLFLYGTGGLAFAKSKASINFCDPDCITVASAAENHFGWVLGGGIEWKIVNNIVIGVEGLHYDFGTQQHNFALNPAFTTPIVLGIKADSTVDVVRGRMSFRF